MKLKQKYEDFYVKELMDLKSAKTGNFGFFLMKKAGWGTLAALYAIAKELRVNIKALGIAGMKDKRGITEQYVSVYRKGKSEIENIKIKGIEIKFLGYLNDRIMLGDHHGNHFMITARDFYERKEIEEKKILNLFDYQRFGKNKINIEIGRALIKGHFDFVCKSFNLDVKGNNYVSAIRTLNRRVLRFLISAYQSYLWNSAVGKLKSEYNEVPVFGFLTDINGEIKEVYEDLLEKEGVKREDFLMRKMPEISSEGGTRKMFVDLKNLKWKWLEDEANKGKFKCILDFDLGKGQYATHVVKSLFSDQG